jgi:hypothetical protein
MGMRVKHHSAAPEGKATRHEVRHNALASRRAL